MNILIISYTDLHYDPRVLRQIQALKNEYQLFTIGNTPSGYPGIIHYNTNEPKPEKERSFLQKVSRRLSIYKYIFKNYNGFFSRILAKKNNIKYILSLSIIKPDIIIANESSALYLATELKRTNNWDSKIYFDAHEYTPKEDNTIIWRLFHEPFILKELKTCKYSISMMSTVSDGIAREYEKLFDFPFGYVKIITNAPEYHGNLLPNNINSKIRLIHHGSATRPRRLDLLIKMMGYLDPEKYELTLMLVRTDPDYHNYIVNKSKKMKNIKFIEPVKISEIVNTLNNYDIGVFLLLPVIFNHKYSLPNKLFEYIQARLAIAIGPSIEMVKIVNKYNLGVHSEDFSPKSLANCIAQLTPEKIMEYKKNSDKSAMELSADKVFTDIKTIIAELANT